MIRTRLMAALGSLALIAGLNLPFPDSALAQQRSTPAKSTSTAPAKTTSSTQTAQPAAGSTASASDRITLRNGQEMNVLVKEITDDAIKYVLADEPEGPMITTAKSRILMMKYRSGRTEVFEGETASSGAPATPAKSGRRVTNDDESDDDDDDEDAPRPVKRKRTAEETKQIETIVQNVSSQLIHCCSRKKENARHEIYYDGIEENESGMRIPIRVSWVGAFESDRWIRGFVVTEKGQRTRFMHQSDSGGLGMGCARNCVIQ